MANMRARGKRAYPGAGRGFTLVELIIAIAIAAVLAAIAMPSYRELMVGMAVSETTNDLVIALNAARSEAVKRGADVTLAPNGTWNAGWILTDAAGETLMQHGALAPHYKVMSGGTLAGAPVAVNSVVFGGTGALKGGGDLNVDLSVCRPDYSPGDEKSRRIMIKASGTISSQRDTSSSLAGSCA